MIVSNQDLLKITSEPQIKLYETKMLFIQYDAIIVDNNTLSLM